MKPFSMGMQGGAGGAPGPDTPPPAGLTRASVHGAQVPMVSRRASFFQPAASANLGSLCAFLFATLTLLSMCTACYSNVASQYVTCAAPSSWCCRLVAPASVPLLPCCNGAGAMLPCAEPFTV